MDLEAINNTVILHIKILDEIIGMQKTLREICVDLQNYNNMLKQELNKLQENKS